jgi:dolichol-phosphate mannosyltransferase
MKAAISIVAAVYNEESVLNELYRRVSQVMDEIGEPWELILVDDGSRDSSGEIIATLHKQDARVKGVILSRNFGFQIAASAGIDHAQGEAIVLIDADLQDPPEIISQMVTKWREGYDVVYGVREQRAGETWFKRISAKMFYRLIRRITGVDIPADTGDFRIMDRRVVNILRSMREHNRFLRGMVPWVGFKQIGVPYKRDPRYAGESKFSSIRTMLPFALTGITSFSYFPLRLATYLGFTIGVVNIIAIFVVIILRLVTPDPVLLGQATTLVIVLFLGSIQLISLGIIGEYLGRIYDETRSRPLYILQSKWGFDASSEPPHTN